MATIDNSFVNGGPSIGRGISTSISGALSGWEAATLTGSWTGNISYVCQRRRVGDNVQVKARIASSSSSNPTPAVALTLNPFSDLTVDTAKAIFNAPGLPSVGYGRIWNNNNPDAGQTWGAELVVTFNGLTFDIAWQIGTAGGTTANFAVVTPTSPFGFQTSDSCFVEYSYPVLEWA